MSQNSKQSYIGRSVEGGTDTKYDQTAVSAAAALQQSLALSPSQLHFMQAAAAAAASPQSMQLSLPWMLPQYQMMVLPEGMQQSLMGGQGLVQLPDGRVILAPISEDGSAAGQTMSSEDVATAEALLRQQLQRQQQALAATTNSVQQQQQQQQLLYQQQIQQHQLQLQQQQQQQQHSAATSLSQQNYVQQQQQQAQQSVAKIQSGSTENSRPDLPPQPKKPLTPYMMFSKAIWPQVKAANTHLSSVCEIGAVIGSLWRDLDPTEKQKYNDQFVREKERYDTELRAYLKSTGLHASDLVKVKAKRNNVRSSVNSMPHLNPVGGVSIGTTLAGNLHPTLSNPVTQAMTTSTPFAGHPTNTQRPNIPATFTTGQQQQLLEAQIGLLQGQSHNNTSSQQAAGVSQAKADVPSQMWQVGSGGGVTCRDSGSEQAALQAQVLQLREALSERTNEVLKLTQTLDDAQKTIELYKTQLAAVSIDATTYPSNAIINNTHTITATSENSAAASSVEAITDNSANSVSDASGNLLPVNDRFENDGEGHDANVEIKAVEGEYVKTSDGFDGGQPDGGSHDEGTALELIVKNGETKGQDCSFDGSTLLGKDFKEENKAENMDVKLSALSDGSELELPKAVLQDDP